MIIKGGSRAAPAQLARHLQRVDTNERVDIVELTGALSDTLAGAFYDWQAMSEGTKGKRGLYHANIDPAKQYTLTKEQEARCVDLLEEELGLQGQPRAVVRHEKHGRAHLHVVWCRTDWEQGNLKRDNNNYYAHERASKRLELEFGHELVPGKFAKRDREKQPEFPRAEVNHAEWQQAERTGMDAAERKEQITALRAAADNAEAFKAALEEAGYVLARGDKRGLVLVDGEGEVFSVSRHVTDIKGKELKAFMASIDQAALPTVEEAKAIQEQRQAVTKTEAPVEAQGPEASKFLQAQPPEKVEPPAQAPPSAKPDAAERKEQITALRAAADNAQAFKAALEGAGYVLAKGDQRGMVLVDAEGEAFSLSKHITDMKGKEFKAFMASIDQASLPTVEEAKALHQQRQEETAAKAEGTVQEAPQPQSPQGPEKAEQPAPAPQDAKKPAEIETPAPAPYDYELYSPIKKSSTPAQASKFLPPETAPVQGIEQSKFVAPEAIQLPSGQPAPASEDQGPPPAAGEAPEVLAIRKAVAERQAGDARQWADNDTLKLRQLDYDLTVLNNGKMGDLDHLQEGALKALTAKQAERRTGVMGMIDAIQSKLNPTAAAEKKAAQEKEFIALILRQQRERKDYVALIEQTRQLQLDDMKERQGLAREMRAAGNEGEAERYVQAHLDAKRLAAELEEKEIHEKLEKEQAIREGMPPPEKGK